MFVSSSTRENMRKAILNFLGEEEKFVFDPSSKYLVSNFGNIFSPYTQKFLKPIKNNRGYYYVKIYNNGTKQTVPVHVVVARSFYNVKGFEVNHIDLDKSNNSLKNLELVTRQENLEHAKLNGAFKSLKGENSPSCIFTNRLINDMIEMKKTGKSLKQIAEKYKTSSSYVCTLIKKGKQNE